MIHVDIYMTKQRGEHITEAAEIFTVTGFKPQSPQNFQETLSQRQQSLSRLERAAAPPSSLEDVPCPS